MNSKLSFKILFGIFLLTACLVAVVNAPLIGLPIIGGVILQGILGGFSGKVGPVVGGSWKGIDYMRGYVVPANPNSSGQQVVRSKWSVITGMASSLLSTLITTFWNPFAVQMSGFNRWIQVNYSTLDGSNDLTITSLMTQGTLEPVLSPVAVYTSGSGDLTVSFDDTTSGNGLGSDIPCCLVYDKSTNSFYINSGEGVRSDAVISVSCPPGLTATNLIAYTFVKRGTGAEFIVSDSVADVASV